MFSLSLGRFRLMLTLVLTLDTVIRLHFSLMVDNTWDSSGVFNNNVHLKTFLIADGNLKPPSACWQSCGWNLGEDITDHMIPWYVNIHANCVAYISLNGVKYSDIWLRCATAPCDVAQSGCFWTHDIKLLQSGAVVVLQESCGGTAPGGCISSARTNIDFTKMNINGRCVCCR